MGYIKTSKYFLFVCLFLLFTGFVEAKTYNILIIHSYQQEFPMTALQHKGFVKGLHAAGYDRHYNIFAEYLNAKTTSAYTEHPDIIDAYIQSKYIINKPDIIYATNDEAVEYLTKTKIGYLKDVPMVVTGITDMPDINRHGNSIEILAHHDIYETINMINSITGEKPRIELIASGNKNTWDMAKAINSYMSNSDTVQELGVNVSKDIDVMLANIKGDSKTVYLVADAGGFYTGEKHETVSNALKKIKEKLPSKYIFNLHELEIKHGLLGGYVVSDYNMGKEAGEAVARVLEKEQSGSVQKQTKNSFVFDYKALEEAKIKLPSELAEKARFINAPPSFIHKYASTLIWIIIVLVLMILIASVTFSIYVHDQHKKLKKTNDKIKNLSRQNQEYMDAVDASNLVSIADKRGRVKYINDTYLNTLGYERSEIIGKDHKLLNHPKMDKKVYRTLINAVTKGDIWAGVLLNKSKDGQTIYLETSIVPIRDENGEVFEYLSIRKDITQVIRQQKEIRSQYTDVLTGLPNRVKMRLDRNNSKLPAVALLNIDGFSIINTFYGMEAGDYLLKAVAAKIKEMLPKGMNIYRISGDEFGILSEDTKDFLSFNDTIHEIMEKISFSTFIYENNEMHFTLSAGTSIGKSTTITKAGIALRQARLSKKSFMTYDEAENEMEKIRDTVLYSGSLRYALMNNGVLPYFMPIVSTETKEIVKYEALMRIQEPNGNVLTPDKFLYMAKKLKLYNPLSTKMIENTLNLLKASNESTCINFDIEDVFNEKLQSKFFELISEYKLQGRITVEITESEGIDNMDELAAFLNKARQHGCLIAIDDFGTGYSNFMYILSLQPDFLKIDGSITRQINVSPRAKLLAQTIADMCRQAGIKTIAEYVSSEDIYETIKEVGIDYCQGYLFGKPAETFNIKL